MLDISILPLFRRFPLTFPRYIRNLTNLVDLGKILNRTEEILDKLTQSHHPIPWSLMGVGWSAEPKTRAASHAAHDPGSLYLMNLVRAIHVCISNTFTYTS